MFVYQWLPRCAMPMGPMNYGYHETAHQYLTMARSSK